MGKKEELLSLFENNKGCYLSGEDIAEKLSVSRTAVWKIVNSLRKGGYKIDAVQNKGYCLSAETDILSPQGVCKYLEPICSDLKIEVLQIAESTNTLMRESAANGAAEGRVIIANSQIGGRGRRGHTFYSPDNTGVYMSILLKPLHYSAKDAVKITTMAAVAVCEAIESVSGKSAQIKWVNDIFVNGKKVCGILTEASFGLEDGFLDYAILGIGINAFTPKGGFPPEIQNIAGSVFENAQSDGKNRLAAEVLNKFMTYYKTSQKENYVKNYKSRSLLIGKSVNVISPCGTKTAQAIDIDNECRLIVEYPDGKTEALSSGDVSVKL